MMVPLVVNTPSEITKTCTATFEDTILPSVEPLASAVFLPSPLWLSAPTAALYTRVIDPPVGIPSPVSHVKVRDPVHSGSAASAPFSRVEPSRYCIPWGMMSVKTMPATSSSPKFVIVTM